MTHVWANFCYKISQKNYRFESHGAMFTPQSGLRNDILEISFDGGSLNVCGDDGEKEFSFCVDSDSVFNAFFDEAKRVVSQTELTELSSDPLEAAIERRDWSKFRKHDASHFLARFKQIEESISKLKPALESILAAND
jgi:hypothetical protein